MELKQGYQSTADSSTHQENEDHEQKKEQDITHCTASGV